MERALEGARVGVSGAAGEARNTDDGYVTFSAKKQEASVRAGPGTWGELHLDSRSTIAKEIGMAVCARLDMKPTALLKVSDCFTF